MLVLSYSTHKHKIFRFGFTLVYFSHKATGAVAQWYITRQSLLCEDLRDTSSRPAPVTVSFSVIAKVVHTDKYRQHLTQVVKMGTHGNMWESNRWEGRSATLPYVTDIPVKTQA